VHVSCAFALAWFVFLAVKMGHNAVSLTASLFLLFVAAVMIVAHEFGHVLAARAYGIKTAEVVVLPIGAVSRLERHPEEPHADMLIAAAGPAVSAVLAVLCWALARETTWAQFDPRRAPMAGIFVKLFWVNVLVAVLNLLPAQPMDGGRIVRALLEMLFGERVAAVVTVATSLACALGFALVAFSFDFFFGVFALIAGYGAVHQWQDFKARESRRPLTAGQAAATTFECLTPDQVLLPLLDAVFASAQRDFPVLTEDGYLLGMVTREAFAKGMGGGSGGLTAGDVMRTDMPIARAAEPLSTALARMDELKLRVLPVLDGDTLVGLLIREEAEDAQLTHAIGS